MTKKNYFLFSEGEAVGRAEALAELLRERNFIGVRSGVQGIPAPDIAEICRRIPKELETLFFRLLPKEIAAQVFVEMDTEEQRRLIESFSDVQLADILSEMYIDDTVDILEEMPATVVKRILRHTTKEERAAINTILHYPKNTAGSLMTTEYLRLTVDMTVGDALSHIRRVAPDKETVYTCYVTDKKRHLIGIVSARRLLITGREVLISNVMETHPVAVNTEEDREEVARKFDKYGFIAIPVVDREGRLVGIVTVDDAIEVMKEESEEDFAKMAAITPSERPYLKTGVFSIFASRAPWLLLLMLSSTLSSAILGGFESVLPGVLVLFIPMIMGTGGNSGGQSSVTVTRGISLGELRFSDIFKVLFKEVRVGALCALCIGAAAFVKVWLVDGLILANPAVTFSVSLTVALSLAMTILIAKVIGAALPLLAKRIGLDPAVMASPLITTLVDALSLAVYFLVARSILGI